MTLAPWPSATPQAVAEATEVPFVWVVASHREQPVLRPHHGSVHCGVLGAAGVINPA
jgi:hypothetical protein